MLQMMRDSKLKWMYALLMILTSGDKCHIQAAKDPRLAILREERFDNTQLDKV